MFRFFTPSRVISKYFSDYIVNLNNRQLSVSIELEEEIEKLKIYFLKYFFNSSDLSVVYFPTEFHMLETIKSQFDIHQITPKTSKELAEIVVLKNKNPQIKIFVRGDFLLYEEISEYQQFIDFFSFNPAFSLDVDGIIILCYQKQYKLTPIFLGSTSAFLKNNKVECILDSVNCGTGNFPVLLLMTKYFEHLSEKKEIILRIVNQYLKKEKTIYRKNIDEKQFLINYNKKQ